MKKILLSFFILSFVLTGCSLTGKTDLKNNGGVFKSVDSGASWRQASLIPTISGRPASIADLNVVSLVFDPNDSRAIYFGSLHFGLFYSYDGAQTWHYAPGLKNMPIGAIAVDPQDKCTIYTVSNSKIYKSEDCSRSWQVIYTDDNPHTIFSSIAIDHYQTKNVYIANTRGDLMLSQDAGHSWQTLHNFKSAIRKIGISPQDSRVMFVATLKKGLFRSMDKGKSWQSLHDTLKDYRDVDEIRDFVFSPQQAGFLLLATKHRLFKSVNNGDLWTEIKLLVPERESQINGVGISAQNVQKMYYVTNYIFYSTIDGGKNWVTKALPTTRQGWRLLVDPHNDQILYLGVSQKS